MQHVTKLFKKNKLNDKPWLIIGKGPSFSKINQYDLNQYYTFGLNHVVNQLPVDITHLIDFDVFEKCQEAIYKKSKYLIMPMNPHFKNDPTEITIRDLIKQNKILKQLAREKRLYWYNHIL